MAFRSRTPQPDASVAVEVAAEEAYNILDLVRLREHPSISPLLSRREALLERKTNLVQGQQQLDAVRQDFEKVHALALAEGEPETKRQWGEVKAQLEDYEDGIRLAEAGLLELDQLIDEQTGSTREAIQHEVDGLFFPEVQQMIAGLQALVERNNRLRDIERCSGRLLQTGNLCLYNPTLQAWINRLQCKLNLLAPQ